MNKITHLVEQLAGVQKEIAELDKLESKASADLLLVASPDISVASARTKILDARLTIDLTTAKKRNAQPVRNKIADELKETLTKVVGSWNESVSAMREAMEEEIIVTNTKFFNGDERAARRWWNCGPMNEQPIFAVYHAAIYDESALRNGPNWGETEMAGHFLRHLKKHAEVLGIKPAELE